jgi:hypothetical protein
MPFFIPLFDIEVGHLTALGGQDYQSMDEEYKSLSQLPDPIALERSPIFREMSKLVLCNDSLPSAVGVALAALAPRDVCGILAGCMRTRLEEELRTSLPFLTAELVLMSGIFTAIFQKIPNKVGWFGSMDSISIYDAFKRGRPDTHLSPAPMPTLGEEIDYSAMSDDQWMEMLMCGDDGPDEDNAEELEALGLSSMEPQPMDLALGICDVFVPDRYKISTGVIRSKAPKANQGALSLLRSESVSILVGRAAYCRCPLIANFDEARLLWSQGALGETSLIMHKTYMRASLVSLADTATQGEASRRCRSLRRDFPDRRYVVKDAMFGVCIEVSESHFSRISVPANTLSLPSAISNPYPNYSVMKHLEGNC